MSNPLLYWNPKYVLRWMQYYYWSFHLINTTPTQIFAELIFMQQWPVGDGIPNLPLDISNIVGISAGSFLDAQEEQAPFEFTRAELDKTISANLGNTLVTFQGGVPSVQSISLYMAVPNATNNNFELTGTGAPQEATIVWNAGGASGSTTGTWVFKSSWASMFHFTPPLAQPTEGEFSL